MSNNNFDYQLYAYASQNVFSILYFLFQHQRFFVDPFVLVEALGDFHKNIPKSFLRKFPENTETVELVETESSNLKRPLHYIIPGIPIEKPNGLEIPGNKFPKNRFPEISVKAVSFFPGNFQKFKPGFFVEWKASQV